DQCRGRLDTERDGVPDFEPAGTCDRHEDAGLERSALVAKEKTSAVGLAHPADPAGGLCGSRRHRRPGASRQAERARRTERRREALIERSEPSLDERHNRARLFGLAPDFLDGGQRRFDESSTGPAHGEKRNTFVRRSIDADQKLPRRGAQQMGTRSGRLSRREPDGKDVDVSLLYEPRLPIHHQEWRVAGHVDRMSRSDERQISRSRHSYWAVIKSRYGPLVPINVSCVPRWTIFPRASTTISSQSRIVLSRCATMRHVHPRRRRLSSICFSVIGSSALVASSSSRTRGWDASAGAICSRCRWLPLYLRPP